MAGKKFGIVVQEKVPASYHTMSQEEQEQPGTILGEMMAKYEGRLDLLRRYWTSAFDAEVTDVFIVECDDPADFHDFYQELTRRLAELGDPDRYGQNVRVLLGVNPDAQ